MNRTPLPVLGALMLLFALGAGIRLLRSPAPAVAGEPCVLSACHDTLDCVPVGAPRCLERLSTGEAMTLGEPLDLNAATAFDIERLPGLGKARARDVVRERERLGGRFCRLDALEAVRGIGPKTVERLREHVVLLPACDGLRPQPHGSAVNDAAVDSEGR